MAETEQFVLVLEQPTSLPPPPARPTATELRRQILVLALPVLGEQILAMLVGFSDRLLAGHFLATEHLAAMTVVGYLLWLVYGVFSTLSVGAAAITARAVGAGDMQQANRVLHQGLVLSLSLALPVTLLSLLFLPRIASLLHLEGAAAEAACTYLRVIAPCIPLVATQAVSIACLRGAGDMMAGFMVMLLVNLLNIGFSWGLCLGIGPLPKLGWLGLALGTAIGFLGGTLLLLLLLTRGRRGFRFQFRFFRPELALAARILRVGIPGGLDNLVVIGCQLWFLSLINRLGAVATAAHGVALSIESLAFLPGIALQAAAGTLAGQFLGAGSPEVATKAVQTARNLGCAFMGTAGMGLILLAPWLPLLFVSSVQAEVARSAVPLLRIIGVGMIPLAVVMIVSAGLRGAGDTRLTLAISLAGFLGIRIPATYLLALPGLSAGSGLAVPGLGLGVQGAWYAMVIDLAVRALLLEARFAGGGWTRVRV
jgi:putative MATE family efflux protein